MDLSPEDLGLAPDLSLLPADVRDLIRRGHPGHYPSYSEAAVEVCAEMFQAGFGVNEIWMIMTDPTNGISRAFYSQDGEQAEAWLDRVISKADGKATKVKSYTPTLLHPDGGGSHTIKTGA
ncbi:MAG TPA: hypothetical protein VNA27_06160 [Rubrobacteraceae bacterium]|nr:hypothetical protein [Rubrobacteraceae bacterium]